MTKRYFTIKEMAAKINITYPRVQYALTMQNQEPVVQVGTVRGYTSDTVEWLQTYFELENSLVLPFAVSEKTHQDKIRSDDEDMRTASLQEGVNIKMSQTYTMYTAPFEYIKFRKGTAYNVLSATFEALKSAKLAEQV